MKKTVINIILIIIAFCIYFLQSNFFNWFNIAGIMPNLFVIFILFIGLFASRTVGTIYGIVLGIILDFIIGTRVGINAVCLGVIGLSNYFLNYLFVSSSIEIISFIKILIIEVLYNIILTIILYPIIQKLGYYIEHEYKGNKILTRYF